jgi:hypothetical protein
MTGAGIVALLFREIEEEKNLFAEYVQACGLARIKNEAMNCSWPRKHTLDGA